jgi:hypothetical protein
VGALVIVGEAEYVAELDQVRVTLGADVLLGMKEEDGAEPELGGSKGKIVPKLKGAEDELGSNGVVLASLEVDVVGSGGMVRVVRDVELVDVKGERVSPGLRDAGNVLDCSPPPLTEVTDSYVKF